MNTCPNCQKEFSQTWRFIKHQDICLLKEKPLTFIDLFCGIGGFHQALSSLGAKCVLACDIDKKCREVYKDNYNLEPKEDITKLETKDIPDFDILCGGFPCQSFSHAGKQGGLEDTRGTLFRDICRILKDKQPKYFLLENVKNLKGHDGGKTLSIIYKSLHDTGYTTYKDLLVLSPHHYGVPQHRERVFILGVRNDLAKNKELCEFPFPAKIKSDIGSILEPVTLEHPALALSPKDLNVIKLWEEFVQHFKATGTKLPTFPLWSDDWDSTQSIKDLPEWKQKFINNNRNFYKDNSVFLKKWLEKARGFDGFSGARRKFEWQCGVFQESDSLWNLLFTFRPSGIRTKRTNYSPALVAMAQIVYVGSRKRKLSTREVARLQSFPDSFTIHPSTSVAYKQFGNSVNVEVIRNVARFLLNGMVP